MVLFCGKINMVARASKRISNKSDGYGEEAFIVIIRSMQFRD